MKIITIIYIIMFFLILNSCTNIDEDININNKTELNESKWINNISNIDKISDKENNIIINESNETVINESILNYEKCDYNISGYSCLEIEDIINIGKEHIKNHEKYISDKEILFLGFDNITIQCNDCLTLNYEFRTNDYLFNELSRNEIRREIVDYIEKYEFTLYMKDNKIFDYESNKISYYKCIDEEYKCLDDDNNPYYLKYSSFYNCFQHCEIEKKDDKEVKEIDWSKKEYLIEVLNIEKNITLPGTYTLKSNLYLEKSISIHANNVLIDCMDHKIISDDFSTIIDIKGSNITIQNCFMEFVDGGSYCLFSTNNARDITIKNNYFYNCQILFSNKNNLIFENNKVIGDGRSGIVGANPVLFGLRLNNVNNSNFNNNEISKIGGGIRLLDSVDNNFIDNKIHNLIKGVDISRSYDNFFKNNEIINIKRFSSFYFNNYNMDDSQKNFLENNIIENFIESDGLIIR